MPQNRFFVTPPFTLGSQIDLREEARHIKAMRIRLGETIELVNGRHQLAKARLIDSHLAQILAVEEHLPPLPVILCQAIPRLNHLDFIVEKGTELGMTELWLFPGMRSEKKELSKTQLIRLKHLTIAAMKQCGRVDLPTITINPPLLQWEGLPHPAYFGDLSPDAPSLLAVLRDKEGVCFINGPESGFSEKEENALKQLGARGTRLHPWILRTETAALVALSLIYTHVSR